MQNYKISVVINILHIAVVGYNYELSCKAIRMFAQNDMDSKPIKIMKDSIVMDDGTKYKAFSSDNNARGHYIDQIIVVDDSRWDVYQQQYELIDFLKYRLYCTSCVPEEYQIQEYEW